MFKSYLYLIPTLLCLIPGCQLQPQTLDTGELVKKAGLTLITDPEAIGGVRPQVTDRSNPLMPLRMAGVLDKTGSTEPNKIPNFTEDRLKTITKGSALLKNPKIKGIFIFPLTCNPRMAAANLQLASVK